jgi:hypothetical protein
VGVERRFFGFRFFD